MQLESTLPSLVFKVQELQRHQRKPQPVQAHGEHAHIHEATVTTKAVTLTRCSQALLDGTCLGLCVACVGRSLHAEALRFVVQEVERCCYTLSAQNPAHPQLLAPQHCVSNPQLHNPGASGSPPPSIEPRGGAQAMRGDTGMHSPLAEVRRCRAALCYVVQEQPEQEAELAVGEQEADGYRFQRCLQLGQLEWSSRRLQTVAKVLLAEPLSSWLTTEGCGGLGTSRKQLQEARAAFEGLQREAEQLQHQLVERVQQMATLLTDLQRNYFDLCQSVTSSDVGREPPQSHKLEMLIRFV